MIQLNNLNNCNLEQVETATNKWMKTVKKATDKAIPKTSYKYEYQLKIAPEIRNLEYQFNILHQQNKMDGQTLPAGNILEYEQN